MNSTQVHRAPITTLYFELEKRIAWVVGAASEFNGAFVEVGVGLGEVCR